MTDNLQWSRRFRPTSIEDIVVGNPEVLGEALVATKKALAMFIVGEYGTGKTTLARAIAQQINGNQKSTIEEPSTERGKAYIEKLQERIKYAPSGNKWVVVIDEAHNLTKDAFTALLKLLEDPPHKKVLITLCTNMPHKVPPEIISRCRRIELEKPSIEDGVAYLLDIAKEVGFKQKEVYLTKLAKKALTDGNFSMRQAVENFESMHDKLKSGKITVKEILNGKAAYADSSKDVIGDIEKVAGSLLLAITDTNAKSKEAVDYILATMSHHDPNLVIERMVGILYYGYIHKRGGKWNWQSKPYPAIFKAELSQVTLLNMLSVLTDIQGRLVNQNIDPIIFAATNLAKLAVKIRNR